MDMIESKVINFLCDLKENYHVSAIKSEFETEGATLEEVLYLKKLVSNAGLEFVLKIGGCEAIRDMRDAKNIGVNTLVAPMIESPYALQKYVNAVNKIFSEEEQKNIKFLINIETKNGFDNADKILSSKDAEIIFGVVMGRTDFTASLGLPADGVNQEIIYEYAQKLALMSHKYGKEFLIGGGVTTGSFPFFRKLLNCPLSKFETQKVIFNANVLNENDAEEALLKAFDFEIMWIKNKQNLFGKLSDEDIQRIKLLKSRYDESVCKPAFL